MPEVVQVLTALQAENDRLRAQASPAWVPISERKPTKEDANENGNVLFQYQSGLQLAHSWFAEPAMRNEFTHWMRLPAPPESAADRQRREDEEAWKAYSDTVGRYSVGMARNDFFAGIAHARKEATP